MNPFMKFVFGLTGLVFFWVAHTFGQVKPPVSKLDLPKARLAEFRAKVEPVLKRVCAGCHGPKKQKGKFRVDALNPDLLKGKDVAHWLEVFDVLSNGEMPPEDAKAQLTDDEKVRIVDWLSGEIQVASQVRRSEQGHTSFRRMTRYEYKYALQDLLGLPHDFSRDLPPETVSEDGFKNSSEMLQMSVVQFEQYRDLARQALKKATVRGERPEPLYYGLTMEVLSAQTWKAYDEQLDKIRKRHGKDSEALERQLEIARAKYKVKPGSAHFKNLDAGISVSARWSYGGAKNAPVPTKVRPEVPEEFPVIAIVPKGRSLKLHVRDSLPDAGNLRVRILASRTRPEEQGIPTLALFFGHQASNNSKAAKKVGLEMEIKASPGKPEFYQWDVPLSELIRNPFRGVTELGRKPNPGEFVEFVNTSFHSEDLRIDYLEITTPTYDQWPPKSHANVFIESQNKENEASYAREVLFPFMRRAWRRAVTEAEVDQKLALFAKIRSGSVDFQDAMVEVLATVLSSPKFLYLVRSNETDDKKDSQRLSDFELASRLSFFLWSSVPDEELLNLASKGRLRDPIALQGQTRRLLADPKAERFVRHFTRQWLGLELLDYLKIDAQAHGRFDPQLLEAMREEPVAFFSEVLRRNRPVMDFLQSDYALVNDRLARHYELPEVIGNGLRPVKLQPGGLRGGVLTQAGLLAMNSDGKDSHPLKRGIWLLENMLNDPPPPPPPAVPEIDLADPEILKLTLKQRMEDHRNDPACISCHAKIDPWGIAFENFDAVGKWRDTIGKDPVDATSMLFNKHELRGMQGLKEYLLATRQDQFVRAMVHKMVTYALGRPLTFGDRSQVDRITADLRKQGDGLADLLILIVKSDLFQLK